MTEKEKRSLTLSQQQFSVFLPTFYLCTPDLTSLLNSNFTHLPQNPLSISTPKEAAAPLSFDNVLCCLHHVG